MGRYQVDWNINGGASFNTSSQETETSEPLWASGQSGLYNETYLKPQQQQSTKTKANQQNLMQKTESDKLQLILCQVPEGDTHSHSLGSTGHFLLPHCLW